MKGFDAITLKIPKRIEQKKKRKKQIYYHNKDLPMSPFDFGKCVKESVKMV